jgi:hypothetical protein
VQPGDPAGRTADLPALFVYLDDHLRDNGRDGTPLFQPMARADSFFPVEKRAAFVVGTMRRWAASRAGAAPGSRSMPDGLIAGHVDLRARPERLAQHRCLLGMGVHRDFAARAGRGPGRRSAPACPAA